MIINKEFDIQAFADANVQTTETATLSEGMQQYYNTELLENAKEELFFNQFTIFNVIKSKDVITVIFNRRKKIRFSFGH